MGNEPEFGGFTESGFCCRRKTNKLMIVSYSIQLNSVSAFIRTPPALSPLNLRLIPA